MLTVASMTREVCERWREKGKLDDTKFESLTLKNPQKWTFGDLSLIFLPYVLSQYMLP